MFFTITLLGLYFSTVGTYELLTAQYLAASVSGAMALSMATIREVWL